MRHLSRYFVAITMLFCYGSVAQTPDIAKPLPADVRVLIDVSGSMKKTDPQNLRKPAMELLVRLLPDNSKAGVWTFGQSVNLLVAHQPVDANWREKAAAKTAGIHSQALFTHIGKSLEQSIYDSENKSDDYRRNIILLTDGVVDISTDPEVNRKEQERIVNELLPRIKNAGYIVHTIALSDGADQELMQKLSRATDGVFAVADNAEELMSTFLRIFDQAVPAERLPLEGNIFLVDDSVEEFTALVFRKKGTAPSVLISPSGVEYTGPKIEDRVNWYKTDRYDLVTLEKPAAGNWQIKADFDPDTRVTVVSDLQLQMAPLANNLSVGEPLDMHFYFQEEETTVTNPEFLKLLDINAQIKRSIDNKTWRAPLTEPTPPLDGVYHPSLELFREPGNYAVRILIDGKTFRREYKHNLSVTSPFTLIVQKTIENTSVFHTFSLVADQELIDTNTTMITATISDSTGKNETRDLIKNDQGEWQLIINPLVPANYTVSLQAKGSRKNGKEFKDSLGDHHFVYPDKGDPVVEPAVVEEVVEQAEAPAEIIDPEVTDGELSLDKPLPEPEASPEMNRWLVYALISAANLLVFGLAFLVYRFLIGKKAKDELIELEKTLDTETSSATVAAKTKPAMQEMETRETKTIDLAEENADIKIDLQAGKGESSGVKSSGVKNSGVKNSGVKSSEVNRSRDSLEEDNLEIESTDEDLFADLDDLDEHSPKKND